MQTNTDWWVLDEGSSGLKDWRARNGGFFEDGFKKPKLTTLNPLKRVPLEERLLSYYGLVFQDLERWVQERCKSLS